MSGKAFYNNATSTSQVALSEQDELDREHVNQVGQPASSASPDVMTPTSQPTNTDGQPQLTGYGGIGGTVVEEEPVDLRCGWFGCRPQWMQKMNTAPWLLVSLCFATLLQGMIVNGFPPSSITSIERRFQFSSQSSGILISMYDATNIVFVLFVVYVGGRRNKIQWVGVGCLLIGVSSFMFSIPHFTTPPYSYTVSGNTSDVCTLGGAGGDTCSEGSSAEGDSGPDLSNYIYLFCMSQVVAGIGSLPLYTLGLAALAESVSTQAYGPYLGIFYAIAVLGPGLGFILSGVFLNIFTEITIPAGLTLSPSDPGWVGAWWLGFVIMGFVVLLVAIPLTLFPKELPTTARIRAEKAVEVHANSGLEETTQPGFGERPSDILRALKYLLINPTFMFTCLGGVADALLTNGFNAFLPKFFENQFALSAGLATTLTGAVAIFGGIAGSLLSGFILRRLKLKIRGILRFMALCNFFSGCLFIVLLWQCPQQGIAGITRTYNGTELTESDSINVTGSCNVDCACATEQFLPVCSMDTSMGYFTACHAGCTKDYGNGTYADCSCLLGGTVGSPSSVVESGLCRTDCSYQPFAFAVVAALIVMLIFMSQIPELTVVFRCVPGSQRSMALGVNSFLKRSLGSVPGPIMFGAVIDQACLLWQDTCGTRGSCWVYNNASLGWRMTVIAVLLKIIACCLYLLAMGCYRPVETEEKEAEKKEAEKTVTMRDNEGASFE